MQIVLRTDQVQNPFFSTSSVIGKRMLRLPRYNYLELELSIKKGPDGSYYCTQCGERFSRQEYNFYVFLFSQAKTCNYNVWKLKELYRDRNKGIKACFLMHIVPGRQKYVCNVSKIVAADILESSNEEKLYDK